MIPLKLRRRWTLKQLQQVTGDVRRVACDVWLVTRVLRLPVAAAQAQAKVDAEAAAAGDG